MHEKRRTLFPVVLLLLLFLCSTCGIDEYLYLDPPELFDVRADQATVFLPSQSSSNFLHYTVYYRIYISDILISGTPTESQLTDINALLYGDYSAFKRYTENENLMPPSTLFTGRYYFKLELEPPSNIDNVLSSVGGGLLAFDFPEPDPDPNKTIPFLTFGPSPSYNLYRSNYGFNPLPPSTSPQYRLFQNTSDLNNSANSFQHDPAKNADVANKEGMSSSSPFRYTYVSLYIMAEGRDDHYSPIYSRPTRIGVFRLPDVSG
jgi:hypothetical protein